MRTVFLLSPANVDVTAERRAGYQRSRMERLAGRLARDESERRRRTSSTRRDESAAERDATADDRDNAARIRDVRDAHDRHP